MTGLIAIRRQGIYFAMITLALSQLIYFVYLQTPFTHGEDGIQGIPQGQLSRPASIWSKHARHSTTSCWRCSCSAFLSSTATINSPFGEVLKSIRENEQRAISLGYRTDQYKLWRSSCPARWRGWPAR